MLPRAPGAESAGGGYDLTTATYNAEVYAFHQDIPDQVRGNADPAIDPEVDAVEFVSGLFLIQREVKWVANNFTTGVWTTDVAGTTNFTKWDDASSDPEQDIDTGKSTILKTTGFLPNTLVVGYDTHLALKRHPLVQDRFKYTSSDSITDAMLARFFELDRYLVAMASRNTAEEDATDSNAFIAGDNALLCYSAPRPGLKTPSAGYTFNWSGLTGVNTNGVKIKRFRLERNASDRIEGEFAYDQKVTSADLGYFFSDCTAS